MLTDDRERVLFNRWILSICYGESSAADLDGGSTEM